MSAMRLLVGLNQMSPDETSTQFKASSDVRYGATNLPFLQSSSPDATQVAHYFVPVPILAQLEEDAEMLKMSDIQFMVLPDQGTEGLVLLSHFPRRNGSQGRKYKAQADEVLNSVLSAPSISSSFDHLIILNSWDVIGRVHDGTSLPILAQALANLDDIYLVDAQHMTRVRPGT